MTTPTSSTSPAGQPSPLRSLSLEPGMRVRVTQQVVLQSRPSTTTVEGVVESFGQQKTGSWFAHSEDKKLWLDRLRLRTDDGEIVCCNLDHLSRVEVVG
ncbi:MAG: hypothetical protein IT431_03340 [Phycisphaerales bacterium]|nr:hypothetical protein [Phycisphaerales bacterium]